MPKSLADGHYKVAVLTAKPADPKNPTVTELNAGIGGPEGASCKILFSDWSFTAADSEKISDRALCEAGNSESYGASNFTAGMTVFRFFDETTGIAALLEDDLYQAAKKKGTSLWVYARLTGKEYDEPWVGGDELYLGAEVSTDNPQQPSDMGGYIKARVPLAVRSGWPDIKVAAGA